MRLCFLGTSHAAQHLRAAAHKKGFLLCDNPEEASLTFVSEDTPTDNEGRRDYSPILKLIEVAKSGSAPVILTSQVEPGFSRLHVDYHQAETLRIKDAMHRAENPDYIVIGSVDPSMSLPGPYILYAGAFECAVLHVTFEEAEFSKIAVNMTLAAQVDNTNRLAAGSAKCGADWAQVAKVISHDKRIGHESYLIPGRWQDSKHLYRDWVTLAELGGDQL